MFLQMDPKSIFLKEVNESEDRNYGHSTAGTIKKPRKEMGAQRKRTENWPIVLSLGHRVGTIGQRGGNWDHMQEGSGLPGKGEALEQGTHKILP